MKRCFAILVLSVFLITYLLPIATLVKADVVIGDNNEIIVNENAYVLGRKIALMESIPNLLNNGVTSLTISNSEDLDSYLDNLWGEIGDAVNYLTSGDWVDEVPTSFRNEALENITNYINYVNDRSNIFADLLRDPTTTLLKTYVIGNNLPKTEYKPYFDTLNTFKKLSVINNGSDIPTPDPDYSYISNINNVYIRNYLLDSSYTQLKKDSTYHYFAKGNYKSQSFICTNLNSMHISNSLNVFNTLFALNGICTIQVYHTNFENVLVSYSTSQPYQQAIAPYNYAGFLPTSVGDDTINVSYLYNANQSSVYNQSSFNDLTSAMQYIYQHYTNVNLYVNDIPWVLMDSAPLNPTLDIDGTLQLYGNDNPPQYDIQNGTQIDYDMLYDTIYNAIINALPIDQQDITYYDSHDTVYSPTIINNYGSDPDGETDFIESILDYAVVPKFETAILAPIETPLTNGLSVLVTVQDTIPDEILYVLGGAFVLLLFVCIINRMLE